MLTVPAEPAYDVIAREYYDQGHETSRNFDATTAMALQTLRLRLPTGLALDVGCGRGRCHEFLGLQPRRIIQLDNSPAMLELNPREDAVVRILHDAEQLPFPEGEFHIVAAFLCDPFLGLNFLSEARRVLHPGGMLIATTPTYEWGSPLRDALELDMMVTRFVLLDGRTVQIPSALYSSIQLSRMAAHAGFPEHLVEIRAHSLPQGTAPVSKDILAPARALGVSEFELPILHTLVAER